MNYDSKIKKYIKKIKLDLNNLDINTININQIDKYFNLINKIIIKKNETKNYEDLINVDEYEINNLPEGINISTMCASCKINTKLNIDNIEKYLIINDNDIIAKKISNEKIETLLPLKKKKKRHNILNHSQDNNKNYFYNQITIIIRVTSGSYIQLDKEPRINMKLFKNGSIQMSGCKSVNNINIALNKIINKMKALETSEFPFFESIDTLKISDFKMDMINSNYKINMQIDRTKLHNLLTKKKIRSTYEQCIKACVIIKISNQTLSNNLVTINKDISIFIFQKGNIIINSAKSKEQIINSYNYINNILNTHKDDIIKKDDQIENDIIFKYYNEIMADVNCGLIQLDYPDMSSNNIINFLKGSNFYNRKKKLQIFNMKNIIN